MGVQDSTGAFVQEGDTVLQILKDTLLRKLAAAGIREPALQEGTDLLNVGLIDSQGLLDVVLEVEEKCGRVFDPENIDIESGVTIGKLAAAFV